MDRWGAQLFPQVKYIGCVKGMAGGNRSKGLNQNALNIRPGRAGSGRVVRNLSY
jgi:hypothetical protein